jgi:DNA replication protein DnaC
VPPGGWDVPAPVEWTATFTDPRLCAAIVDRLTFDAHIITTGTDSYRLRTATARHQAART